MLLLLFSMMQPNSFLLLLLSLSILLFSKFNFEVFSPSLIFKLTLAEFVKLLIGSFFAKILFAS